MVTRYYSAAYPIPVDFYTFMIGCDRKTHMRGVKKSNLVYVLGKGGVSVLRFSKAFTVLCFTSKRSIILSLP